jgi:hypothetical protein
MILFANIQEQFIYQQNSNVGILTNKQKKFHKQTKKLKPQCIKKKINLVFTKMFNFFGFKPTSMQALFQSCWLLLDFFC